MSLFRRIWLTIIGLTLAAFLGSLLVNTLTARGYLEKQLSLKNMDNATALALSMSQIPDKDPVTIELLLSAQFDTGHYQEIRLTDPSGQVMVERRQEKDFELGAPAWFAGMLPIEAAPGVAHVQDGWKQFGTITLASQSKFAYRDLWQGTLELLGWFLAGGILAGLLGSFMLRLITRPLNDVVEQAHAITERRFMTVPVPKVPELRKVVQAMNEMVQRLKQMFSDEASRLETLRHQVNFDTLTGLVNRPFFVNQLHGLLEREEEPTYGSLLLIRIVDLAQLSQVMGAKGANELIRAVAEQLRQSCANQDKWFAARLNGSDFALVAPALESATPLANSVAATLRQRLAGPWPDLQDVFHIGATRYGRGMAQGELMAEVDRALATAESKGGNTWHALDDGRAPPTLAHSQDAWRNLILNALEARRYSLAVFPTRGLDGALMHHETALRMQSEDGNLIVAGDFMPMAQRLKLIPSLDLESVRLALAHLSSTTDGLAVNLSPETMINWETNNRLLQLLRQQPERCRQLWFEIPEYGAFENLAALRSLAVALKGLGCRIGIEHFGHRFGDIAALAELGLDYIKVDGSFIRDIQDSPGNQELLRGLCKMAHALGMSVIAEGVHSAEELAALPGLGFDGMTGPGLSA